MYYFSFLVILNIGIQNIYILYSNEDTNHIYLIRLVVMKRPGFQSQKYGIPSSSSSLSLYNNEICELTQIITKNSFKLAQLRLI